MNMASNSIRSRLGHLACNGQWLLMICDWMVVVAMRGNDLTSVAASIEGIFATYFTMLKRGWATERRYIQTSNAVNTGTRSCQSP